MLVNARRFVRQWGTLGLFAMLTVGGLTGLVIESTRVERHVITRETVIALPGPTVLVTVPAPGPAPAIVVVRPTVTTAAEPEPEPEPAPTSPAPTTTRPTPTPCTPGVPCLVRAAARAVRERCRDLGVCPEPNRVLVLLLPLPATAYLAVRRPRGARQDHRDHRGD